MSLVELNILTSFLQMVKLIFDKRGSLKYRDVKRPPKSTVVVAQLAEWLLSTPGG